MTFAASTTTPASATALLEKNELPAYTPYDTDSRCAIKCKFLRKHLPKVAKFAILGLQVFMITLHASRGMLAYFDFKQDKAMIRYTRAPAGVVLGNDMARMLASSAFVVAYSVGIFSLLRDVQKVFYMFSTFVTLAALYDSILAIKACANGEGCPDWVAMTLNFIAAIAFLLYIPLQSRKSAVEAEYPLASNDSYELVDELDTKV